MRTKKGIVTSDKRDKTVTVTVHTYKMHPKYQKKYRTSKKYHAHDPENTYKMEDEVTIYESIPLSKQKRWTVVPPADSSVKKSEERKSTEADLKQ